MKDEEAVLKAALDIWEAQSRKKRVHPTDLDHDHLALNEPKLGASGEHDVKREKKPVDSARILPAPQGQDSIERERRRELQWQSICDNDIVECPDGTRPKWVLYRGTICDYKPGVRPGLPWEWSYKTNQPAFSVTVDTTIRLILDVMRQCKSEARQCIRAGGLEAAKLVRRGFAELLEQLIEEQSTGQITAIWRVTE